MILWASGNQDFGAWCLSDRISYHMDSKISPPYPKSWGAGVYKKTFSECDERSSGMRDIGLSHGTRSYSPGDDHPAEICCGRCGGEDQGDDGEPLEEKVFVVERRILERECGVVPRVFRIDSGRR